MGIEIGLDEYTHALKLGQREVAELSARGKSQSRRAGRDPAG